MKEGKGSLKTVISGSFRKYFKEVSQTSKKFKKMEIEVLAPLPGRVVTPGKEFARLSTDDKYKSPEEIEIDFMRNIFMADFLYVVDEEGYAGESVATEIGYARLAKIPIILSEKIVRFGKEVPKEVISILKKSAASILTIKNLNLEKIEQMRKIRQNELTLKEIKVLKKQIKNLLKKLKSIEL